MRYNLYTPDFVRIWLRFLPDGCGLEVDYAKVDAEVGDIPEWLEYELDSIGTEFLFDTQWKHAKYGDCELNESGLYEALTLGIAPYQPFCVEVTKPHWYRCSYEYDEWDYDYDKDVIEIAPMSKKQTIWHWSRFLRSREKYIEYEIRRRKRIELKRRTDVQSMHIQSYFYCLSECYYDGPCTCGGIAYRLATTAGPGGYVSWLAEGRSDKGDHKEAREELWSYVKFKGIPLTEEHFNKLVERRRI